MSEGPAKLPWFVLFAVMTLVAAISFAIVHRPQPILDREELKQDELRIIESTRDSAAVSQLVFATHIETNNAEVEHYMLIETKPDQRIVVACYKTAPMTYRRLVLRKRDGQWAIAETSPASDPRPGF